MAAELEREQWDGFTEEAMAAMLEYRWPGNVRELRNVVERAVYRWDDSGAPIAHIQFDPFESPWKPASLPRIAEAPSSAPAASPRA
ncbi:hypothetical protein LTR94_032546, partial [Friedmanniomyces endolithicus]